MEPEDLLFTLTADLAAYSAWLESLPISSHTRRGYRSQVHQFANFLKSCASDENTFSSKLHLRDSAEKYREHLRDSGNKASSINTTLTAIDNFCSFLNPDAAKLPREITQFSAPRILTVDEQLRFLETIKTLRSIKERCIAMFFFEAAIRTGECVRLSVSDIHYHESKMIIIIAAHGRKPGRKILASDDLKYLLEQWMHERSNLITRAEELFLNRQGERFSQQGIDALIRKIGASARIFLSASILRQTSLSNRSENIAVRQVSILPGMAVK